MLTNQLMVRAATRRTSQIIQNPMRRQYATGYEERKQKTLKTSSRLTWLTTSAAAAAAIAYYYTQSSASSSDTPTVRERISHMKYPDIEAPKPVEDRHGDTVAKHAIAAHKNQTKVREGVFKGGEFDNHLQKHSTDPGKDFEKK